MKLSRNLKFRPARHLGIQLSLTFNEIIISKKNDANRTAESYEKFPRTCALTTTTKLLLENVINKAQPTGLCVTFGMIFEISSVAAGCGNEFVEFHSVLSRFAKFLANCVALNAHIIKLILFKQTIVFYLTIKLF